jgi:flavin-dependent dehydrogenase
LVADAAPEIAAKIKGEVIKQKNTIIEKILLAPMPDWTVNGASKRRRIFSPSCRNHFLQLKNEVSLLIEYRPLVGLLAKACVGAGAELSLNTVVTGAILDEKGQAVGVSVRQSGVSAEIRCKAVVAADGWDSLFRKQMHFTAPNICPAFKAVVEGADIPDDDLLEFYLLTEPAGALWVFPKGKTSAECGLTYWDNSPEVKQADLRAAWERHRHEHPILKERLRNASAVFTSKDGLIFGGVLQDFVRPGIALLGDAAGHVGASGGSGILSSLTMGYEAGSFLGSYTAEHSEGPDLSVMQRCMETMKSTDTWRMLQSEEQSGGMVRHFLFNVLQTSEQIDNAWDVIADMAK